MPEERTRWHVSGAVVSVIPDRQEEVAAAVAALDGVEVHAAENARIVITIEGWSTGALGDRLNEIGGMDGVIAANMVYEQADEGVEAPS